MDLEQIEAALESLCGILVKKFPDDGGVTLKLCDDGSGSIQTYHDDTPVMDFDSAAELVRKLDRHHIPKCSHCKGTGVSTRDQS